MSVPGSSPLCSSQGHDVVAATRNPERLADFGWHDQVTGVRWTRTTRNRRDSAFAERGTDRRRLLPGARHRAAGLPRGRQRGRGQRRRTRPRRAGVRRIVYLGGFVPDDDELSEHLTSRAEVAARVERRRRPRGGVAGRGDDHRRGVDVVRDAALRRRPVPADADAGVDGQPDRPDLDPRRPVLPRRRRRRRPVPAGAYDISGPETTTYARPAGRICARRPASGAPSVPSAAWTPAWCRW